MMRKFAHGVLFALPLAAMALPAAVQAQSATDARPPMVYVVKAHDNLFELAAAYMVNPAATGRVQTLNRIREPRHLPVGMQLRIPRELLRTRPIEMRIVTFSGPVTLGGGAAPQRGQSLAEGSELQTGVNGFVTLSGSDGSRVTIPSNSRLRINRARQFLINSASDIDIEVRQGRAEVRAAPQKPQGQFQLRTPVAVSAVRGTVFRVSYSGEGAPSTTEVVEGTVAVSAGNSEAAIKAGFGAAATASGLAQEALLAAPAVERPGKVQTDPELSFTMKPVSGAQQYHAAVARDASFLDLVAEDIADKPEAHFPSQDNGTYFVRSSAISPSGIEGQAETWSFRRQRVGLKASVEQTSLPNAFRINWLAEGSGTSLYRFQLFAEGNDAVPVIDEAGLTQPGLTLTALARGAYRSRVGVIQTAPDGSAEVWTPLQKFNVSN